MDFDTSFAPMFSPENGYSVDPAFTVGETIKGYTPPGILDGIGAYELNNRTVRILANHELLNFRGNAYAVSDGQGGTFTMTGARISYFDIDKQTFQIKRSGLAYNTIYDANGNVASDTSFLSEPFATNFGGGPGDGQELAGFSRFCSSVLVEAGQFGNGSGLVNDIYFAGEEDGGGFNSVGGAEWALDVETGNLWQVPAMGRGAWENITEIDTGTSTHVAFILADDSSPFDADDDGNDEAAPLFLYVGEKKSGDFLDQNGLRDGDLYVWVANNGNTLPSQFNGNGSSRAGEWVEIDNSQNTSLASQDGSTGFDEYGYASQSTLWTRAEAVGAFGFSRPEDVAFNPDNPSEVVLASTGVDTYDIDPISGNGSDTFGTMYTIDTTFDGNANPTAATTTIIYDGDADPTRALRSPDNLDWADDGLIYIQEDEAEEDTASGDEVLFGTGAANPNEASIVTLDPQTGAINRVGAIDRSVVVDPTISDPFAAVDVDADPDGLPNGEWESSGILDVSTLFGQEPGSLFVFDVQAHGIEDQEDVNPSSRLNDDDLVEGGQLLFLIGEGGITIDAGNGKDTVTGLASDDLLAGGNGNDKVFGGAGKDRIEGGKGKDRLFGEAGGDRILGNEDNDRIFGGPGNDKIRGGPGNDRLTGDDGSDLFIVSTGKGANKRQSEGRDRISDFEFGVDRLKIKAKGIGPSDITIGGNANRTTLSYEGDIFAIFQGIDVSDFDSSILG